MFTVCPVWNYGRIGVVKSGLILITWEQHTSGNKKAESDANKDAETQVKAIAQAGSKGQDKVVADLLKAVFDVKPIVPDRIEAPQ